jgi:uncharacterized Zn finger protein
MERARRGASKNRGGIRANTEIDGSHWWTNEWVAHIEKISANPRLISAARNSARAGNVLDVSLNAGTIEARVQGRGKVPYQVRFYCELPTEEQLTRIKSRLSVKAGIAVSLLSGEIPHEVKYAFAEEGITLLPGGFAKNRRLCNCPDQENACKHILAVLFVLAGVVDRDPMALLKIRGLDRDDLLECLLSPRDKHDCFAPSRSSCGVLEEIPGNRESGKESETDGDLPLDASFYGSSELPSDLMEFRKRPSECANFPDPNAPIFNFPFWKGETTFSNSIEPYYENVQKALRGK